MLLELTLPGGERARIVAFDGQHVALDAPLAMPPGSTLQGSDAGGASYSVKVRSCKRQPGGAAAFRIEGRFVSLSREQRAKLLGQSP
jgi:hypothetical protein